MQHKLQALSFLLLITLAPYSGAQVVLRLPNPFKRARLAAQARAAAPAPPAEPTAGGQGTLPDGANNPSSSSTDAGEACPPDWALAAIGASSTSSSSSSSSSSISNAIATTLPASTERVLICLISSGVHTAAPALKDNRWTGCAKEDPLDPTGCTLPWNTNPSTSGFKPRGTWAASILAGSSSGGSSSSSGVISGGTDIHVVPIDSPSTGSVDPGSTANTGKSRLRAYSVCEGRLRGLQANEYSSNNAGKAPWRMVMLVDVAADQPASTGTEEYALSEAEWVKVATGEGPPESPHAPDVLVIAPAGQRPALSYPAALPGVVAVSGHKCSGEALHEHPSDSLQPDVSAPGEGVGIPGSDKNWTDDTAAAAVVAGAAARLWSAHPSCSAEDIKAALKVTASEGQVAWLSLAAAEAALQLSGCASGGGGQVASTSERLNPTV